MADEKKIINPEEISQDELEAVAGGKDCTCFLGGGGTGSDLDGKDYKSGTCACVTGGGGEVIYENGDRECRCWCALTGGGTDEPCEGMHGVH